jgi:hypothetical protein
VHRDAIWTCFTMVASPLADQNKSFLLSCFGRTAQHIEHHSRRQVGGVSGNRAGRVRSMEQLEMHCSLTEKQGKVPPEWQWIVGCMTKRERSGESVDGCGAQRACRVLSLVGDLQIQRPGAA